MNAKPKGLLNDLTDTERQLSKLVFAHYRSNPQPGQRSRVSDGFARNMRGDEACIMKMATLLAKMVASEHADKVGEVAGFYITPARLKVFVHKDGVEVGSISDIIRKLLKPTLSDLLEHPLHVSGLGINLLALWARAFVLLQKHYSEVEFDQKYAEVDDDNFRPGIRGEGVNVVSVNGALLEVLREANLLEEIEHSHFASHEDEDGWVFSCGSIDG